MPLAVWPAATFESYDADKAIVLVNDRPVTGAKHRGAAAGLERRYGKDDGPQDILHIGSPWLRGGREIMIALVRGAAPGVSISLSAKSTTGRTVELPHHFGR